MPIFRPAGELGFVLDALDVHADLETGVIKRVRDAQKARDGLGGDAAEKAYREACEAQQKFYRARANLREQARALGATEKDIQRLGIPASRIGDFE